MQTLIMLLILRSMTMNVMSSTPTMSSIPEIEQEEIDIHNNILAIKAFNEEELCTDCWCLPDDGPEGQCPSLEERNVNYTTQDINQFLSFNLTLTLYEDLPHLYPKGGMQDPTSDDPVCTPYPDLQKKLNLPSCEEPVDFGKDAVCAFFYNEEGCSNREYGMKTYSTLDDAVEDVSVVTHLGACGVCSNANDLAINLRPDLTDESYECGYLYWSTDLCYKCYLDLGFTPDCAWVWTTNTIHTARYCKSICLEDVGEPINDPDTCALNDCFMCDETKSGPNFVLFGGRTRRESGIITDIVRDCEDIANIFQDPCVTVIIDEGRNSLISI